MAMQDYHVAIVWAARIHKELGLDIPLNVSHICDLIGLEIKYRNDMHESLNAFYLPISQDAIFVVVNSKHSVTRQRYSIMHEAAHHFINIHCPRVQQSRRERFCQVFAANVLMPAELIRELAPSFFYDPCLLAKKFDVSRQAMEIRLKELNIIRAGSIMLSK